MIVSAHQPHYIPWLGYLDKVARSDLFVIMDDLQYESQNFQNRQKLKFKDGVSWLTVPIIKGSQNDLIKEKQIDNSKPPKHHWQRLHRLTLESNYKKSDYWEEIAEDLEEVYSRNWERLLDLNLHIFELARKWFEIDTPSMKSSFLRLKGDKTDRLIDLCRKVDADIYLSGGGGSARYLDVERMNEAGIEVIWQNFEHPIHPQRYSEQGFASHLGFLDYIFNCGRENARILLKTGSEPILEVSV